MSNTEVKPLTSDGGHWLCHGVCVTIIVNIFDKRGENKNDM